MKEKFRENFILIPTEPCLIKGCTKPMKNSSRGLCVGHVAMAGRKVNEGKTTWEELEAKGLARRKFTREENIERRNHPHGMRRYS